MRRALAGVQRYIATVETVKEMQLHPQGLVGVLRDLHDELDAAVLAAYGLNADATEQDMLAHLLELNTQRPWPATLPEQVCAVADLLARSPAPLTLPALISGGPGAIERGFVVSVLALWLGVGLALRQPARGRAPPIAT